MIYKVTYLLERIENNQTIYNKAERVFRHKQDCNSFIETIGRRFLMVRYMENLCIH